MTITVLTSVISHVIVVGISHLGFPLLSANTSAGHVSLSGEVIQTFILEGFGPLAVLHRLDYVVLD